MVCVCVVLCPAKDLCVCVCVRVRTCMCAKPPCVFFTLKHISALWGISISENCQWGQEVCQCGLKKRFCPHCNSVSPLLAGFLIPPSHNWVPVGIGLGSRSSKCWCLSMGSTTWASAEPLNQLLSVGTHSRVGWTTAEAHSNLQGLDSDPALARADRLVPKGWGGGFQQWGGAFQGWGREEQGRVRPGRGQDWRQWLRSYPNSLSWALELYPRCSTQVL